MFCYRWVPSSNMVCIVDERAIGRESLKDPSGESFWLAHSNFRTATAGWWGRRVRVWRAIMGSRAMPVLSRQRAHVAVHWVQASRVQCGQPKVKVNGLSGWDYWGHWTVAVLRWRCSVTVWGGVTLGCSLQGGRYRHGIEVWWHIRCGVLPCFGSRYRWLGYGHHRCWGWQGGTWTEFWRRGQIDHRNIIWGTTARERPIIVTACISVGGTNGPFILPGEHVSDNPDNAGRPKPHLVLLYSLGVILLHGIACAF